MNNKYCIFKRYAQNKNIDSYANPLLPGGHLNYKPILFQHDSYLKVAFYDKYDCHIVLKKLLYISNQNIMDYKGIPARLIYNKQGIAGIMFKNNIMLYPSLPEDTYHIGVPEQPYDLRWQCIYANYYIITFFRGSGEVLSEELMTEKNGKSLKTILGYSSAEQGIKNIAGYSIGSTIWLKSIGNDNGDINIIPVEEHELPSDFPKDLILWLP